MYYRGKMFGFVHLYNGQEAVSTGVIKQLRKDDYVTSTYRDHVHAISKGCAPREVMAELFGKTTGVCRGQGGSMHMFSKEWGVLGGYAFIGEGIPVRANARARGCTPAGRRLTPRRGARRAGCDGRGVPDALLAGGDEG
jgi:pyruvate dehydrogenase E1 component alpha subunit